MHSFSLFLDRDSLLRRIPKAVPARFARHATNTNMSQYIHAGRVRSQSWRFEFSLNCSIFSIIRVHELIDCRCACASSDQKNHRGNSRSNEKKEEKKRERERAPTPIFRPIQHRYITRTGTCTRVALHAYACYRRDTSRISVRASSHASTKHLA